MQIFLKMAKKAILFSLLLIGASGVGVAMLVIGEGIGVRMERSHVAAQEKSTNTFVDKTVKGTTDTDPKSRTAPDPWNSKDN